MTMNHMQYKTSPFLNKYEKTKVLYITQQLANNLTFNIKSSKL